MRPADVIRAKRDGETLPAAAIRSFVGGIARGEVADYQASAFLMAVFLNGMDAVETSALACAMRDSGDVMDWADGAPVVDKHSTGGVGDKVSLALAPVAAVCGLRVPMISGRGLGHTGGTLDKLAAIPGFSSDLEPGRFRGIVDELGFAMAGQGDRLAPADRTLYALRDVTATVECRPLIVSSILSKKAAEGLEGLVLDVKCGGGAFQDLDGGRSLAADLVATAQQMGMRCAAWLTDMDRPLGLAVGNAPETAEALACLGGHGPGDLREVVVALAGEMLRLGGLADDEAAARSAAADALDSGAAAERFAAMVEVQGGDPAAVGDPALLAAPDARVEVRSGALGTVAAVDARGLGKVCLAIGAGRARAEDEIDPAAGLVMAALPGDEVVEGDLLCTLQGAGDLESHVDAARACFSIPGPGATVEPRRLLIERVGD